MLYYLIELLLDVNKLNVLYIQIYNKILYAHNLLYLGILFLA